MTSLVP